MSMSNQPNGSRDVRPRTAHPLKIGALLGLLWLAGAALTYVRTPHRKPPEDVKVVSRNPADDDNAPEGVSTSFEDVMAKQRADRASAAKTMSPQPPGAPGGASSGKGPGQPPPMIGDGVVGGDAAPSPQASTPPSAGAEVKGEAEEPSPEPHPKRKKRKRRHHGGEAGPQDGPPAEHERGRGDVQPPHEGGDPSQQGGSEPRHEGGPQGEGQPPQGEGHPPAGEGPPQEGGPGESSPSASPTSGIPGL